MAHATWFFWNFTRALACLAGCGLLDLAKNGVHDAINLAHTLACWAGFDTVAGLGAAAFTVRARIVQCECNFFFYAKNCIFKTYGNFCSHVLAAVRPAATLAAATK